MKHLERVPAIRNSRPLAEGEMPAYILTGPTGGERDTHYKMRPPEGLEKKLLLA